MPSIRAAETACRTSRPPLNDGVVGLAGFEGLLVEVVGVSAGSGVSGSPRSMKTSQTRSWAGKGME